jgi:pentatricopeptide repeat protein
MRALRLALLVMTVPTLIGFPFAERLAAAQRKKSQTKRGAEVPQRRQEELTHQTFEQQMELLQKKQEGPMPRNIPEEKGKPGPETGARRYLGIAWQYCNRGDYSRAINIFTTLSSDPTIQWEAKYGLAMCYSRKRDAKKAIPLLEELIGRKLFLRDSLPTLLALLVEEKEYSKAANYVKLLSGNERLRWEDIIRTRALMAALEQAKTAGNLEGLTELIRVHSDMLEKCQSPEVFLEASTLLVGINDTYAIETYKKLLASCLRKWDIRLGTLYALKRVLPPTDTLSELDQEERRTDLDPAYRTQLTELRVSVLRDQLAAAQPNAPEVENLAREILNFKSDDKGALATLAWWYFNHGQFNEAANGFATLARRYPEEPDYLYGLANALVKLKRIDEARTLIEQMKDRDGGLLRWSPIS